MKKIFISLPMRDKSREDIEEKQGEILAQAGAKLQEDVELVPNCLDRNAFTPLECLGISLGRMSGADFVVFGEGWKDARWCRIERLCAEEYGIPILDI